MIIQENDTTKLVFGYGSLLFGALLHKPHRFIIFREIEKGEIGLVSETKRSIPECWTNGNLQMFDDENSKYVILPFNFLWQVNKLIDKLKNLTFNFENLMQEVNIDVIVNDQTHKVDLQFNGPSGVNQLLGTLELLKKDFELDNQC